MSQDPIKLEFFFDPICPWAYLTSRWILEVRKELPLEIQWRFISLAIVNRDKYNNDPHLTQHHKELHEKSLGLLRAAAFVRNKNGNLAVENYYSAVGHLIHVDKQPNPLTPELYKLIDDSSLLPEIDQLTAATTDTSLDEIFQRETEIALARAGNDVGTPIITYDAPDGPTFFGPVISKRFKGSQAVELFKTIYKLATTDGFHELKQSVRKEREL
jgi:2-hydroxychromene-2-carboxylate isomerase